MSHRIRTDLVFAEPEGFRPLSLDLHLPDAEAPAPVVVFVHGGGWRIGSRRTFTAGRSVEDTFGRIVAAGWAVASVDYRLSGEAVFPAPLEDVRSALAWLRAHGAELGLDTTRLVLWGESAGGHLAALAGLTDAEVSGVVDWYGPANLRTFPQPSGEAGTRTREAQLLGAPVAEVPELAAAASPVTHVHPDAPPFLLAHGDADTAVPFAQSEELAARLREVGATVELQRVSGAEHVWRGVDDLGLVFAPALSFLARL